VNSEFKLAIAVDNKIIILRIGINPFIILDCRPLEIAERSYAAIIALGAIESFNWPPMASRV
jgi:hypothetical protein